MEVKIGKIMANERITEGIVRDHFKGDALFKSVKWEEQKSSNKRIAELLKGKSKGDGKGNGYPEFIISFPTNGNYIIVVECKAKTSDHESEERNNAAKYAVDGALHYAEALKDDFNVIAIAVSGEREEEMEVSHFYWKKQDETYAEVGDKKLLDISSYLQIFADQFFISDFIHRDIAAKAMELNNELFQYSIKELSRCTIVSAILLALTDKEFVDEFADIADITSLGNSIIRAINRGFLQEVDEGKRELLIKEFEKILLEPLFKEPSLARNKGKENEATLVIVKDLINYLQINVFPLVKHDSVGYDIIGQFYTEFIRYAGSEQDLGLVLTPPHITELFCDLVELRENDIVYDPCCGTGGFLVAAIQRLFRLVGNDMNKRNEVKCKQICGCELRPDMYTYACSNMRFRGDGKSNIYNGDCFKNADVIKSEHRPTVAFLNPPYGKNFPSDAQMRFIEHALDCVNPMAEGRVAAIVMMSCAIKNEKSLLEAKKRILRKHHLKAVLSMPDDLFYPIGVVACIMVFEANKPNAGRKTWFGYFKDDGFEKRKYLGRIDARDRYTEIKNRWLGAYRNLDEVAGLSVRKEVGYADEWCAEAYMETDYSTLCDDDFVRKMRDYAAFMVASSTTDTIFHFTNAPVLTNKLRICDAKWGDVVVGDWFDVVLSRGDIKLAESEKGDVPLVSSGSTNNGVVGFIDREGDGVASIFEGNVITIDMFCNVFYQSRDFYAVSHGRVNILKPKEETPLNSYNAMFIITVLGRELYRFNYGRAVYRDEARRIRIKLPVTDDGRPDWLWMEDYIKGLGYSGCL